MEARAVGDRGPSAPTAKVPKRSLKPNDLCPYCEKPLDLYYAWGLVTLYRKRLYLRCQGSPRCDFFTRYRPVAANSD
jgi:hypothetical protein